MIKPIHRLTCLIFIVLVFWSFLNCSGSINDPQPRTEQADVLVYGATPSGIMTAIAVKREGKSVIIVEPGKWVGGILGAGLKPIQDMPNYEAVGGTTRDLLKKLGTDPLEKQEIEALAHDPHGPYREVMKKQSPRDIRADF